MNNLNKRNKAETRFKLYGISAVIIAITFLFVLFAEHRKCKKVIRKNKIH